MTKTTNHIPDARKMVSETTTERGTLNPTEPHPSAQDALVWLSALPLNKLLSYQEAYSSCAIEGNRLGEVCSETIRRLLAKESVSDRYLLGLCWAIRSMQDEKV